MKYLLNIDNMGKHLYNVYDKAITFDEIDEMIDKASREHLMLCEETVFDYRNALLHYLGFTFTKPVINEPYNTIYYRM